jgi:hypothetical protein
MTPKLSSSYLAKTNSSAPNKSNADIFFDDEGVEQSRAVRNISRYISVIQSWESYK